MSAPASADCTLLSVLLARPAEITLIDRSNHHLFQPLLYQVATAALSAADIATPIRVVFARHLNVRVIMGEVTGVDPAARTVAVRDIGDFPFDILLLATGSSTSWFGHPEWTAASTGLKTLDDAEEIRRHLSARLSGRKTEPTPAEMVLLQSLALGACHLREDEITSQTATRNSPGDKFCLGPDVAALRCFELAIS